MIRYRFASKIAKQYSRVNQHHIGVGRMNTRLYNIKQYKIKEQSKKYDYLTNYKPEMRNHSIMEGINLRNNNYYTYVTKNGELNMNDEEKKKIDKKVENIVEGSWNQQELMPNVTNNNNDELKKIIRYSNKQMNATYHKLNTYAIYSKFHYPNQFSNAKTLNEKLIAQVAKNTYWEETKKEPIRFDREAIIARVQNAENALRKSELYKQFKKHAFETKKEHRFRILSTIKDKLLKFVRTYGALGVILHFSIYFGNIALFYMGLESMPIEWREWVLGQLESWFHVSPEKFNSKGSNFALAWIMTKFTEPIRLLLTVSLVRRLLPLYNRRVAWIVKNFKFWSATKK
mmetsp:Transcript_9298/g.13769  ORF Transcript_9298/g.13769 Transcript_9298/m.13769 type:complete len:344 (-) Transcript_9298:39-1070(-)